MYNKKSPQKKQSFQKPHFSKQSRKPKTYTGMITLTRAGFGLIFVEEMKTKVEIENKFLNTALHRDTVEVCILGKSKSKGTVYGEVINIVRRAKAGFAGKVISKADVWFVDADDTRMDFLILIPENKRGGARLGQKVFAVIDEWTDRKDLPVGRIEKVLGEQGDNNGAMYGIALEKGFDFEFPKEVENETKKIHENANKPSNEKRRDMRGVPTCTIDPFDAKDFDDALSVSFLENGTYEIGIHIADVSHYMQPGSALDKEAYRRATSVYLVDRTIPMLPEILSNDLCSLRPNEDKKTFSAVFTMNDKGEILSEWFGRTLIHSNRRFTYEEAQDIIESGKGELSKEILLLNTLAHTLTKRRFDDGALSLESDEVKFTLDDDGKPIAVMRKERKDAHKMIEEFMLLANRRVAYFCGMTKDKKPRLSIYRIHEKPSKEKLEELVRYLDLFGYHLTLQGGELDSREVNKLVESIPVLERSPIQTMIIRSMQKAKYSTKNFGHFGLAFPFYTHFTSPIRRYPDVMIHRILTTYLENGTFPSKFNTEFERQCEHSSFQEKEAMEAERQSIKVKQTEYMAERIGQKFQGVITGITAWGIYVEETESKSEGMISLRNLTNDSYTLSEREFVIRGEKNGTEFRIGDTVAILVHKVDLEERTIDYTLSE